MKLTLELKRSGSWQVSIFYLRSFLHCIGNMRTYVCKQKEICYLHPVALPWHPTKESLLWHTWHRCGSLVTIVRSECQCFIRSYSQGQRSEPIARMKLQCRHCMELAVRAASVAKAFETLRGKLFFLKLFTRESAGKWMWLCARETLKGRGTMFWNIAKQESEKSWHMLLGGSIQA